MAKESFLVYGAWQEPLRRLSNENKGLVFWALLEYHNTGIEMTDLPLDAQMAFLFMKNQMDLDSKKYETKCAQRAVAGKISAEKKAIKKPRKVAATADISTKATNVDFVKQNQQTATKPTDNEKENEKEKENVVDVKQDAHTTTATTPKITKELIDRYRAELSNKFYVPGRTDAICRAAMIHYKGAPFDVLVSVANGQPPAVDYHTGKAIWEFDKELDIAAALRTWKRRIVEKWEADNGT